MPDYMPNFLLQKLFGIPPDLLLYLATALLWLVALLYLKCSIIFFYISRGDRDALVKLVAVSLFAVIIIGVLLFASIQKESLENDRITTHYEINKVGNNLVFQRKDKASYLVKSKSVEIKEENEKEYVLLVVDKTYKINKDNVK